MRDAKVVQEVWEELPAGVVFVKHYGNGVDLVACAHDAAHRYEQPSGTVACRVCMGDEFTTSEFAHPVKKLVKLAAKLRNPSYVPPVAQESLF